MTVDDTERERDIQAELKEIEQAERRLKRPKTVHVGNALLDLSVRKVNLLAELQAITRRAILR